MRDTIIEAVSETINDLRNSGLPVSFTEKELKALKIDIEAPTINADEIKAIRETINLSQSVFAKLLNVSLSSVRQWEQGARTPTGSTKVLLELLRREPHLLDYKFRKYQ